MVPQNIRPDWTIHDPGARGGDIDEITVPSAAFGEDRHVGVYVPARFRRSRRYPLLVIHDGFDYLRYASLQVVLDNLIQRLEIPPLIAALTQSPNRLEEYAGHDAHTRFVATEIPEFLEHSFPLHHSPAARGLMGASFGAVASLHAAWRHPGAFGRLVLQSGSFAFADIGHHRRTTTFDPVARFVNEFRRLAGQPAAPSQSAPYISAVGPPMSLTTPRHSRWRASERMATRLGPGLLDTEITKSVVDGVATGSELPNAPDMTFNGQFRYQWPVGGDLKVEALLAANYQGDLTFDVVRDPPEAREKGYWLADARLGIGAQDDRWNVSIWGRNPADERYRTQVLFSSVGFGETWGAPRTYGVSLSFKL